MRRKGHDFNVLAQRDGKTIELQVDIGIRLREMTVNDADELYNLINFNRAQLREWLPWLDRQQSVNDSYGFIESVSSENQNGTALIVAIECDGFIIGVIGFHEFDNANRQAPMGYWISASEQGKGIVTKSCRKLIAYGFNDLNLRKVLMSIATGNIRSRKIAQRIGLLEEGVSRQSEWLYDHYVDHVIYSIIADDW